MAINTYFQNIATAIREKTGAPGLITPAQMPDVIRSISGGGGDWAFMDDVTAEGSVFTATITGSVPLDTTDYDAGIQTMYNNYARSPKPTQRTYNISVDASDSQKSLSELLSEHPATWQMEYYGYVYGTSLISNCNMTLLFDGSQGTAATITVPDISTYEAVALQGIYQRTRTSQYNTTMIYVTPKLNTRYWTGMKDRNTNYDCFITFTSNTTAVIAGNYQFIMYGM